MHVREKGNVGRRGRHGNTIKDRQGRYGMAGEARDAYMGGSKGREERS